MVVFELWLYKDRTRWLVGMDERVAASLPAQFSAQCPGLDFTALDNSDRPNPLPAANCGSVASRTRCGSMSPKASRLRYSPTMRSCTPMKQP